MVARSRKRILLILAVMAHASGCNQANNAELARAKAEADAAKAELAKVKAEAAQSPPSSRPAPSAPKNSIFAGELFVTTGGGDVKKAAGIGIRLVPITPEFRQRIKELYAPIAEASDKHKQRVQETNAQFGSDNRDEFLKYFKGEFLPHIEPLWATAEQYLASVKAIETTTNSEGKFRMEVPEGSYLFVSAPFTIVDDSLMWCKNVKVSGAESSVSYNQDATVIARSAFIMDKVASEVEK